jgi:hypothetical protein
MYHLMAIKPVGIHQISSPSNSDVGRDRRVNKYEVEGRIKRVIKKREERRKRQLSGRPKAQFNCSCGYIMLG